MEYLALGVIALGICCLGAILLFELDRMNTTLRFIEEELRYFNNRCDDKNSNVSSSRTKFTVYPSNKDINQEDEK